MLKPSSSNLNPEIMKIPVSARRRIYHRLQELMIPCRCPVDSSLVEVNHAIANLFVRSHVQQSLATRQELLDSLEHICTVDIN